MRPNKLTKEIQDKIVHSIKAGNYIETAAVYSGITKKTLYNWMKRANDELTRLDQQPRAKMKKSEAPFVEFLHAVEEALAFSEARDVNIIAKAAEEDWKAAAWRLKRKFPDRWGDKIETDLKVSGKDGGPIQTETTINLSSLSDEELSSLETILTKTTDTEAS
jgi:transposase